MFENRADAGRRLAGLLENLTTEDCIVYGMVRGGVPVAYEIAIRINKPIDVFIARKIGLPGQEELALGALAEGKEPTEYLNYDLMKATEYNRTDLEKIIEYKLGELRSLQKFYRDGQMMLTKPDATAILVDDGVATGATLKAAIGALKAIGQRHIVIAVPAGQISVLGELKPMTDRVVCLEPVTYMEAVGEFYRDFDEISHEDAKEFLLDARRHVR